MELASGVRYNEIMARQLVSMGVLLLSGCYLSHPDPGGVVPGDGSIMRRDGGDAGRDAGPDGGCGTDICGFGERCCSVCGSGLCVPTTEMCPDITCSSCSSSFDCPFDQYCSFGLGSCGAPGAPGTCVPRPIDCPPDCPLVCGCDSMTYCSACEAAALNGVSVAFDGPCEMTTCGPAGIGCSSGEYCDLGPTCGADGSLIGCRPIPIDCPSRGTPVCGCDGSYFANACSAAALSVTVAAPDFCGPIDATTACTQLCGFVLDVCGATPSDTCVVDCVGVLSSSCSSAQVAQIFLCATSTFCAEGTNCLIDTGCI